MITSPFGRRLDPEFLFGAIRDFHARCAGHCGFAFFSDRGGSYSVVKEV